MVSRFKTYYVENKEEILEQKQSYYQRNRETILRRRKEYRAKKKSENPNWRKVQEMAYITKKSFEDVETWFNKQWMKQQAQCAICGKVFSDDDCIDHNHETLELRGLLCSNCNVGIGMLGDNPDTLNKASNYLLKIN